MSGNQFQYFAYFQMFEIINNSEILNSVALHCDLTSYDTM
jgi:hypothetical protein